MQNELKSNIIYQVTGDDLQQFAVNLINDAKERLQAEIKAKQDETYLSADEVCQLLGCDRSTLWRWGKREYLKPIKIGNKLRYPKSQINKMVEEGL